MHSFFQNGLRASILATGIIRNAPHQSITTAIPIYFMRGPRIQKLEYIKSWVIWFDYKFLFARGACASEFPVSGFVHSTNSTQNRF